MWSIRRFSSFVVWVLFASVLASPAIAQETPAAGSQPGSLAADAAAPSVVAAALQVDDQDSIDPPVPPEPELREAAKPGWTAEVARGALTPGRDSGIGETPVAVKLPGRAIAGADAVSGEVNVLAEPIARQLSPFGAAVSFEFSDTARAKTRPDGPFELTFDLSDVNLGELGDVYERLAVTRSTGCALFEPDPADYPEMDVDEVALLEPEVLCESSETVDAEFTLGNRRLVVEIDAAALDAESEARRERVRVKGEPVADPRVGRTRVDAARQEVFDADGGERRRADRGDGARAPGVDGARAIGVGFSTNLRLVAAVQDGNDTDVTAYAVGSGAASSSGDYSAVGSGGLTTGDVGLSSGAAEVSYPIAVPPAAAGPQPSVAFVYSSAGIDGMTMAENSQAGPLGVGWGIAAGGSITRKMTACSATDPDRCFSSDPDGAYTLSVAGTASTLVKTGSGTDGGTAFESFALESDPYWRVRLYTGGSVNGSTVSTPDDANQWWSVETPTGLVYTFGSTPESVDWIPVGDGCVGAGSYCDRAYVWNVSSATDDFGNQMLFGYNQESNWYKNGNGAKDEYVRASQLTEITYGGNTSGVAPNARVLFDYEWRCGSADRFGNCVDANGDMDWNLFFDTPLDLWCGPISGATYYTSTCTQEVPTFWSLVRLSGVLTQVANGPRWATVSHEDPNIGFERDTTVPESDSVWQQSMFNVQTRPISILAESFESNGYAPLMLRDLDSDSGVNENGDAHDIGTEIVGGNIKDGEWAKFEDVWLGSNSAGESNRLQLRAAPFRSGKIKVYLDSMTGTPIATFDFTGGTQQVFETFDENITALFGIYDVYLVAERTADTKNFVALNSLRFRRASSVDGLPEVSTTDFYSGGFDYRDNRVNSPTGVSAMRFHRIDTLTNELGGETKFDYGSPITANHPDYTICKNKTSGWDTNTLKCFAQWDNSNPNPDFANFFKWPVNSLTRSDPFSFQPAVTYTYNYSGAAWARPDNPDLPSVNETWNEFRGYNIVTVTDSLGKTETRFHQGMHLEPTAQSTPSKTLTRSDGTTVSDNYAWRGRPYEARRLTLGGTELTRTRITYGLDTTVAGMTGRDDPTFAAIERSETIDDGIVIRADTAYGSFGEVRSVVEHGNTASSADNRTTVTSYYNSSTGNSLGAWRGPLPCVTAIRSGNSTTAPSATSASGFTRYTRLFYDGNTTGGCSAAVTAPVATRAEVANNGTGRLNSTFTVDGRGRVTATQNPSGNSSSVVYDPAHGQVTSTTNPLGWNSTATYDQWRRPSTATDASGRVTTTGYDVYSRPLKVVAPGDTNGSPTVKVFYGTGARPAYVQVENRLDGSAYTKSAQFVDGFGRPLLSRSLSSDSGENLATASRYNSTGQPQRASATYTISNDNVTTFAYPSWTNVVAYSETDYDAELRPATIANKTTGFATVDDVDFAYTVLSSTFTDANGNDTITVVNGFGQTVSVTEDAGVDKITSYSYNGVGDLLTVNAPDGEVTTMTYDKAGRRKTMDDPDTGDWSYSYRPDSVLDSQTDPSGTIINITSDVLGRPLTRTTGATTLGSWTYDPSTSKRGLLAQSVAGDVTQAYSYDTLGRVLDVTTTVPDEDDVGDYDFKTAYTYRDDHQVATESFPSTTSGAVSETVTYGYDSRTGLATDLTSSAEGVIVDDTTFTNAGQLAQQLFGPAGADGVAKFSYDAATLRLTRSRGGTIAAPGAWQDLRYTFDGNGNVVRVFDDENSNQYQCFTYDKSDRLIDAYTDNTSACNGFTATGDGNYDDNYQYSLGGNLTSRTGNGAYTYGDAAHAHAVTALGDGSTFSYDTDGNMITRNLTGEPNQTLAWDVEQRLDTVTVAGGDTTSFLYDADGARVRRQTGDTTSFYPAGGSEYKITAGGGGGGNPPPTSICYVQASGGGILLTWQNQPGTEVVRNSSGWVTTPPSGTLTYTDAGGSVNDGWLIRRSGVDEICQIYVPGGGGGNPPTNICYVQASGGGILLTWQNQPGTEVVRNSSGWVTTPPSGTLTYTDTNGSVNDGWLIRRSGVDEICQIYVPGGGGGGSSEVFTHYYTLGGRTVGYTVDGTVSWLWTDQINSTGLTRTDTGVNSVQRYAPWGEIRTDGNLTTDRQYTGQINDQATGLLFYNARYYDPTIGRFISPDTIIASPGDGQNYNRYSYVNNNPIRYNDPSGRCFELCPPPVDDIDKIAEFYGEIDGYSDPISVYIADQESGEFTRVSLRVRSYAYTIWFNLNSDVPGRFDFEPTDGLTVDKVAAVVVAVARFTVVDERPCLDEGGSVSIDVGCGAEAATAVCLGPSKTICKGGGKVAKGLIGRLFRRAPTSLADDIVRSTDEILAPGGARIGTAGSRASIREVPGGLDDARALFTDLSRGGTVVADSTYPGTLIRLPDGGTVGIRTTMTNSPGTIANIDVNIPGIDITKIKFN